MRVSWCERLGLWLGVCLGFLPHVGGCADESDKVYIRVGAGSGATSGAAGTPAQAGQGGDSGASGAGDGASGTGAGTGSAQDPETGRLVGITRAHNAVRARADNPKPSPALSPLAWSDALAQIAQEYAETLADDGCRLDHSGRPGYGENLAYFGGIPGSAVQAVEGWAAEVQCYEFGEFMTQDACDSRCIAEMYSTGCGHYTQIVWRDTREVGCGVASCPGGQSEEIWVCNYQGPGNYLGEEPY